MKKFIVKSKEEYFRNRVERMKEILAPITIIMTDTGNLVEASFTFKSGTTRSQIVGAGFNANVTHMKIVVRDFDNCNIHFKSYDMNSYTLMESWSGDGSVRNSAPITAMYELAYETKD